MKIKPPETKQYAKYDFHEVGFGTKPAIMVIDFQKAFTDSKFDMGGAPLINRAVKNTSKVLAVGRTANIPVVKCIMGYSSERELPYWKIKPCEDLILGRPECDIDQRIHDPDYDMTIVKNGPSIFFQTPVMTFLTKYGIDTTIITGCVTSGCVRASIVDSFQYGFRTIVPEDCVGDHDKRPHQDNLRDIKRRYADISSAEQVIQYIKKLEKTNQICW